MDYARIYNELIIKRKRDGVIGYSEKHHIIPRCVGGTDDSTNLVRLTAREHYVAHSLLVYMYKDTQYYSKLVHAFMLMSTCSSTNQLRTFKVNSRLYNSLKKIHASRMSMLQSGKGNSQYDTIWITDYKNQVSKKILSTDNITEGWVVGRVVCWTKYNLKQREKTVHAHNKMLTCAYKENKDYDHYYNLWLVYKNSKCTSIRGFCRQYDTGTSHVTLTKFWNRFNFK